MPGSVITFTGEHGKDARTYRVSFARILSELREWYRPAWNLDRGGAELVALFDKVGFTESQFRGRMTNRLPQVKHLMELGRLDADLHWL